MIIRPSAGFSCLPIGALLLALLPSVCAWAHSDLPPVAQQVRQWLESLGDNAEQAHFGINDPQRFAYNWLPGSRAGISLSSLNAKQRDALQHIFQSLLSSTGLRKVDAILATEAALGVISAQQNYRDPERYFTAVFGEPGSAAWALRFEGHHLSVNLSFSSSELVAATPLFLGANPETVPQGPDKGLRALHCEVDLARRLAATLKPGQLEKARGGGEWFAGFLTDPGERRMELAKPAGIAVDALDDAQQAILQQLIDCYLGTIGNDFAATYRQGALAEDWPHLYFFWRGEFEDGHNYYYRIAGKRLLIEQENRDAASHVHAIWRDAQADFAGAVKE